ncbi:MAG: bifunctional ADP-dependent NAD(P)H-hydrate dehydratase/NAD(P)H-hydrate epimerase [Chitinophagaceae bacterium]|nr:bifunctional ADP-dependent NAD(P)H-hydrate dehydratase/NAD(P)H-hydrate epimerase [Chitinophagaceae bacterium]
MERRAAGKDFVLKTDKRSADCAINLERLHSLNAPVNEISNENDLTGILKEDIVIDALVGTGLNKPLQGIAQLLVQHINDSAASIISIDMPSGLFADSSSIGNTIVQATYTLSFQCSKLAFLFSENSEYTGEIHVLNIGLLQQYYKSTESIFATIDKQLIQSIYKPRKPFAHKYSHGHALLYAGSKTMMGAALLSAKACLRSGAGLVTVHTSEALMPVIQTAIPEAISSAENDFELITKKKAAIGIGPGLEINDANSKLLQQVIKDWDGPLVIDAAGLSLLQPLVESLSNRQINPAILTPHTGEFEKLFGKSNTDFERMRTALRKAAQSTVILSSKEKTASLHARMVMLFSILLVTAAWLQPAAVMY